MTKERAIELLQNFNQYDEPNCVGYWDCDECVEALYMAIEALEQIESGRYIKGECSICSKEFGTLGCCTTVSNHWVYSCKEGMAQYVEALEQEPIIHCKDCKHWHEWENGAGSCHRSDIMWVGSDYDDFCSFAEKRGSDGK